MNNTTLIVGVLAIAFGVFSGIMRFVKPSVFKKLEPMKQRWGEKAGNVIHFVGYVIAPVFVGGALVYAGINGVNLLDIIR